MPPVLLGILRGGRGPNPVEMSENDNDYKRKVNNVALLCSLYRGGV